MKYLLGVDGGNTKTDFFLFNIDLKLVDFIRGGSCSHESYSEGFIAAERMLRSYIEPLLLRNKLTTGDVVAAVFGLAGVDTPNQKKRIEEIIERIGFSCFKIVNDSFLGIKAASDYGYGVSSVNGTGTSSGGVDPFGNVLQVGGIGYLSGDEAGGKYIAREAIKATFDELYRFGKKTSLTPYVMDMFNVTDKLYMMEAMSERLYKLDLTLLTIQVFEAANHNDEVALDILKKTADNLARSAGGVVSNLSFLDVVPVVLIGSVWAKGSCPVLVDTFKERINFYTNKNCEVFVLKLPPATGAVIWAYELYSNSFPKREIRDKIIAEINKVFVNMDVKK